MNQTREKLDENSEDHLRAVINAYNNDAEERFKRRQAARALNLQPKRPEDSYFSKLDSNLKKNTTFVKKVKNFNAAALTVLLADIKLLNLTKYVSEIASAIVEARLKIADILPACELCCALHQLYQEFEGALLEGWKKSLTAKAEDSKFRSDLRLLSELILCGLFGTKGLQLLSSVLMNLTHEHNSAISNASHVLAFCRGFGDEFAGLVPREVCEASQKLDIPMFNQTIIPPEKQKAAKALFTEYYEMFCKHLLKMYEELKKFEQHNRNILQTKGELSANRKGEHHDLTTECNKLIDTTRQLSEIINLPMPSLPQSEPEKAEDVAFDDLMGTKDEKASGIWEDEETQKFYEVLPNLHEYVPHLVPSEVTSTATVEEVTEEQLDQEVELPEITEEVSKDTEDLQDEPKKEETEAKEPEIDDTRKRSETPEVDTRSKILISDFVAQLSNCCNRDDLDNMAIEFILNLNTKHNRKKLARGLFSVNRTRLDLLPFFSRLVAIVHPVASDVSVELCHLLKHDFLYHYRKKDQINIETKIKIVRFIGELVKFKLYAKLEALFCIKLLLQDFNHHHIDMLCNLLETCGRFLYCQSDSHPRTKVYLEQMMRKKSVMNLDPRYATMIENALYSVVPREGGLTGAKERPPLHAFIRHLLYQELTKQNIASIVKIFNKIDWSNENVSAYIVKCLVNAWMVKYLQIKTLAALVAELSRYWDFIQTEVLDGVLEDIRLCLEAPLAKYNQRRIAMVKYLGELYYYHMADSSEVFKTLYLLISFGVTFDYSNPSPVDPPGHVFRLRLVCVLLETCGSYFKSSMKKLDYFLAFFQNYYWYKKSDPYWTTENPFPPRIEYLIRDTILSIRPKMLIFHSAEEAAEEIELLKTHFLSKINFEEQRNQDAAAAAAAALPSIQEETDENKELQNNSSEDEIEDEDDRTSNTYSQSQGDELSNLSQIKEPTVSATTGRVECPEDEDFMSAFDKLVADQMQDRLKERVTPSQIDIAVPIHVRANAKKTYEQLSNQADANNVSFVLMMRKGSKQTYKNLSVPVDSELAMNLKQQELAAKMEKERVKKLTLDINERIEEEDYQDMMAQSQRPTISNINREKKQKYQHPKGVPDVDLIFGSNSKGK